MKDDSHSRDHSSVPPLRFSSEALLQQAIAGLLNRMPDATGVQILQGALELGKDIVFFMGGAFDERIPCACVIKNTRISGEAGASTGARTIFNQAQQAFDSPYIDENGQEVFVERVYIITPFTMPQATVLSIKGLLGRHRGQVRFIGGTELLDLFRRYWPSYVSEEASVLERHLVQTHDKLEDEDAITAVASQYHLGHITQSLKAVYVPQRFHKDLRSFRVTRHLSILSLDPDQLRRELTGLDLNIYRDRLKTLRRSLDFLGGSAISSAVKRRARTLKKVVERLTSQLDTTWASAMTVAHAGRDWRNDETLGTRMPDTSHIERSIAALRHDHHGLIVALEDALDKYSKLLPLTAEEAIKLFKDTTFLECCAFADHAIDVAQDAIEVSTHHRLNFSSDLMTQFGGSILIVGAPGFGKTSFCRWHALHDIEAFNCGSHVLPVYVPLQIFARADIPNFDRLVEGAGLSALLTRTGDGTAALRVRLYLDGLDEVPQDNKRDELLRVVRDATALDDRYQVIVTARDYVHSPFLDWLPRVSLSGFEADDINEFVIKWLDGAAERRDLFFRQFAAAPALKPLMQVPLLATLIMLVFRQTGKLPEHKTRLYELSIDLLSGGWDAAKGILRKTLFGQRVKVAVLTALAARSHRAGQHLFDTAVVQAAVAERAGFLADSWQLLCDELIEDGLLTLSGGLVQFSHLSFQEFLTAKDFIGDAEPTRMRHALYALFVGNDRWKEVVEFYVALSGKPLETSRWIVNEFSGYAPQYGDVGLRALRSVLDSVSQTFPEVSTGELGVRHTHDPVGGGGGV